MSSIVAVFTRRASLLGCVLLALVSTPSVANDAPVILVVGDSLSAGYGMELNEAWPRLLQKRLEDNGHRYRVLNASITGDTTQGGRTRLPRLLEKYAPAMVIIELGGNDGLRGFSLDVTRANLAAMIEASRAGGAQVLLTGITLPPNYGPSYIGQFESIYVELAEQYEILLVPFLLEDVALVDGMIQADGIHPTATAQPVVLDNVWEVLEPALAP